jgi:hypothetical protein
MSLRASTQLAYASIENAENVLSSSSSVSSSFTSSVSSSSSLKAVTESSLAACKDVFGDIKRSFLEQQTQALLLKHLRVAGSATTMNVVLADLDMQQALAAAQHENAKKITKAAKLNVLEEQAATLALCSSIADTSRAVKDGRNQLSKNLSLVRAALDEAEANIGLSDGYSVDVCVDDSNTSASSSHVRITSADEARVLTAKQTALAEAFSQRSARLASILNSAQSASSNDKDIIKALERQLDALEARKKELEMVGKDEARRATKAAQHFNALSSVLQECVE